MGRMGGRMRGRQEILDGVGGICCLGSVARRSGGMMVEEKKNQGLEAGAGLGWLAGWLGTPKNGAWGTWPERPLGEASSEGTEAHGYLMYVD
jgi:hypothetical protein